MEIATRMSDFVVSMLCGVAVLGLWYLRASQEDVAVDAPGEGEDVFAELECMCAGSASCVPELDCAVS